MLIQIQLLRLLKLAINFRNDVFGQHWLVCQGNKTLLFTDRLCLYKFKYTLNTIIEDIKIVIQMILFLIKSFSNSVTYYQPERKKNIFFITTKLEFSRKYKLNHEGINVIFIRNSSALTINSSSHHFVKFFL